MDITSKESIKNANKDIKKTNLISRAIETIDILTDNGDKLKMRELKRLTSIRNYSILKEAVICYQKNL